MFTFSARWLRKTLDDIATACFANASGKKRRPF
jgi:hypothetical protein